MLDTIDELYARWQKNPADAGVTTALCDALRESPRPDLVDIVGDQASRQLDVPALVAAARMYEGSGRFDDAQQVLVAAGRLAPRDGEVFRCLGVVLLRRGDAERATQVLERAVQFGANGDANAWLSRARSLLPTQRSSGMIAVAGEIAKSAPASGRPSAKLPSVSPPPRKQLVSEDELETLIKDSAEVADALAFARSGAPPPAAGAPPAPNPFMAPQTGSVDAASRAPVATAAAAMVSMGTAAFGSSSQPAQPVALELPRVAPPPPRDPFGPPLAPVANEPPMNPMLAALAKPAVVGADGQRVPEPRDVLDALQIAGVFEPEGAVRPNATAWDAPTPGRRRVKSFAALVALALALVGGGSGTYYYVQDLRAKQHVEAEKILAELDKDLATSDAKLLEPTEKSLTRVFDLESRSQHAALTWLHERAMVGLTRGGENVSFESAAARAKEVGVDERKIAFAHVASFLFQNDTAGAASKIAQWDGKADDDAWYQLLAGATFERAGDGRALERYAAAVRLDPELVMAQILLARATAIDGEPQKAAELAKAFRAKYPERVEGAALAALAWARDPARSEASAEVKDLVDKGDALPVSLRAVPHAVRAILAIDAHKADDARAALQKGLGLVDSPGSAAWLGGIALATGDEALARKAALSAVSYSAVYPPARVLAARVALLGGRLDEALKAAEELPASSPDVAVVTAAVAYEKLDAERLGRSLEAMADDAKKLPFVAPLVRGHLLLAGQSSAVPRDKALEMADGELPWGDLVAMDAALDTGDLELAEKIAGTWKGDARPLRVLRLARLARYEGKLEDADRLSRVALEGGTVTLRSLAERVFVLVAANKDRDAMALFKSYPNVGGGAAKWLRAFAIANGGGKMDDARTILAQEDPPANLAPLPTRVYSVAAYGATKDTRHGADLARSLVGLGFVNPDVTTAAEKVGVNVTITKLRRR